MHHVFVWTVSDVVGIGVIGLLLLTLGALWTLDKIDTWQRKAKRGAK